MSNRILSKAKPNVRKVGDKRYPSPQKYGTGAVLCRNAVRMCCGMNQGCGAGTLADAKPAASVQEYSGKGVLSIDMRYVPPLPCVGCEYAAAAGFRRPPQRV